jgi:hypothetical protein
MTTYIVLFDIDAHPDINLIDLSFWADKTFESFEHLKSFFEFRGEPLILSLGNFMYDFNKDVFFQGDLFMTYVHVEGEL